MDWDDFLKGKNKNNQQGDGPIVNLPNLNIPPQLKLPGLLLIGTALLIFFLANSSFYTVAANEKGIILRFGKYIKTSKPGFHWKLPSPIEKVYTPNVTEIRREEIGFRTVNEGPPAQYRDIPLESLMLTGDENIIDIDIAVQYKILDPKNYLFNIRKQRKAVRDASEAAIREIIGSVKIDEALTVGKFKIQEEAKKIIQKILDRYNSGITIDAVQLQDAHPPKQVIASFKDVASAREDKNRRINEAQGYRNSVIPETRGKVAEIINASKAYKEEKIKKAIGDANRFTRILKQYSKAKDVTRRRLYLEALEEVFSKSQKFILDKNANQVLPLLPLKKNTNLEKTIINESSD